MKKPVIDYGAITKQMQDKEAHLKAEHDKYDGNVILHMNVRNKLNSQAAHARAIRAHIEDLYKMDKELETNG